MIWTARMKSKVHVIYIWIRVKIDLFIYVVAIGGISGHVMSGKSDSCVNTYFVEGKKIYGFLQVTVADMFVVKAFIK